MDFHGCPKAEIQSLSAKCFLMVLPWRSAPCDATSESEQLASQAADVATPRLQSLAAFMPNLPSRLARFFNRASLAAFVLVKLLRS